jgi:tryptophan synthase alpha chain
MNRISEAFQRKKAFIGFVTGGDPDIAHTGAFIRTMAEAGADLIEIGVPFSDPIAEGPVIQEANIRALAAGTTVDKLFDLVACLRAGNDVFGGAVSDDGGVSNSDVSSGGDGLPAFTPLRLPICLMTYLNPVFCYGYEAFFQRAAEAGVDGIIIPDMPWEEQGELKSIAQKHGVAVISLVAPTSEDRVKNIAREAEGFLYLVSSMGVTGVRKAIDTDLTSIISAIREVTDVPVAVGFGIHAPEQAAAIAKIADGVIVGSAIVKIIAEHGAAAGPFIGSYVKAMGEGILR